MNASDIETSSDYSFSLKKATKKCKKPKRNISAFHIFSKELHAQFNESDDKVNPNKRMALISERWQTLPEREKIVYFEKAKTDKWRYLNELNEFYAHETPETHEPKIKPKKFGNAFTFYLREKKEEVRHQRPELSMSEIMSLVAKMWREASQAEKQKYIDASEEDKQRYKQEVYEMTEAPTPNKMHKKTKLLKNAQKLEKTIDDLIHTSLEATNKKINYFKEQMLQKQLSQSTKIIEEFTQAIKIPLDYMRDQSKGQPAIRQNSSKTAFKKVNISEKPAMNEGWQLPKPNAKAAEMTAPAPFEVRQNSFDKLGFSFVKLNSREYSIRSEFPFMKEHSFRREPSFRDLSLEKNKSELFMDFPALTFKKDQLPSFTSLANNECQDLSPLPNLISYEKRSTSTNDHSSETVSAGPDTMVAESSDEKLQNESQNQRRGRFFNTVVSNSITMDSSLLGLSDLLRFDSFTN